MFNKLKRLKVRMYYIKKTYSDIDLKSDNKIYETLSKENDILKPTACEITIIKEKISFKNLKRYFSDPNSITLRFKIIRYKLSKL